MTQLNSLFFYPHKATSVLKMNVISVANIEAKISYDFMIFSCSNGPLERFSLCVPIIKISINEKGDHSTIVSIILFIDIWGLIQVQSLPSIL